MLAGIVNELEGIECGARATAKDTDHEFGIVGHQFFKRSRPVVGDFQKHRPADFGDAGERADDVIVEESGHLFVGDAGVHIRIEDFEKVAEALAFGLDAEVLEILQGLVIPIDVVGEGDRVKAEVGTGVRRAVAVGEATVFDVIDRGGAKRA